MVLALKPDEVQPKCEVYDCERAYSSSSAGFPDSIHSVLVRLALNYTIVNAQAQARELCCEEQLGLF